MPYGKRPDTIHLQRQDVNQRLLEGEFGVREGQKPREGQQPAPSPPSHGSDATAQQSTISLTASCPLRPRHGAWSAQGYTGGNDGAWVCPAVPGPQEAPKCILPTVSSVIPTGWEGGCGWQVSIPGKLASVGPAPCPPPQGNWPPQSTPLTHLLSPKGRCSPLSRPHHPLRLPLHRQASGCLRLRCWGCRSNPQTTCRPTLVCLGWGSCQG